jgi:hypothetical protein
VTKYQLHVIIKSLLSASRRQNELAIPGDVAFDLHMSVAVILSELAHVAHDVYCATHTNEGETHLREYTDNETS